MDHKTKSNFGIYSYQSYHYSQAHWNLLQTFRSRAIKIVSYLEKAGFPTLTYGSIARGDISVQSDIDILLLTHLPSYQLELALDASSYKIIRKYLVQSTPNDLIKLVYELPENIHLIILMTKLSSLGYDFYNFGGALTSNELTQNIRKPGVNKDLLLIEPTPDGHISSPIIDRQDEIAKILGISDQMVRQRIRVLQRRKKKGRTGVFLHQELELDENAEARLYQIARVNRLVRRRLEKG
ncbi:MAG: nucleotidyltransferase domain-containing protein [Candidatus Lokiarchaeota archaeon]|nr:nucleotidyltransferase domain-containing protein [Candidatus Harpocratesius repetitus]